MFYESFSDDESEVSVAILLKESSCNRSQLILNYIEPLEKLGLDRKKVVVIGIPVRGKKLGAAEGKNALKMLKPGLDRLNIKRLLVANSELFKYLMSVQKVTDQYGQINKGKFEGYEDIECCISVDYNALFYNESLKFKLDNSLSIFAQQDKGNISNIKNIIHSAEYPYSVPDIAKWLLKLHSYEHLVCDIEAFSLQHKETDPATIGFAWDEHNGIAFDIYHKNPKNVSRKKAILRILKVFFETYQGKLTFHGSTYDLKIIINSLWPDDVIKGLEIFDDIEDSMLITYLATNSTHETPLGLKENSFEFTGNYAEDVKDISLIKSKALLVYNVKDCLATHYVLNKYIPTVIKDKQVQIYEEIFKPSIKPVLYMMLNGLPISLPRVAEVKVILENDTAKNLSIILKNTHVVKALLETKRIKAAKDNLKLKKKVRTVDDFPTLQFNPNSDNQLRTLFQDVLDFPVINYTKGKKASTDAKTIEAYVARTKDVKVKALLKCIQDYISAQTILSTFISAFERFSWTDPEGNSWLFGNLKLGGTQSGRLSSNTPNLQNLPSSSKYGKLVKSCFIAPPGWLWAGADFASLEERIGTIKTKDPNRIKIYVDGYDGHCVRAHKYFGNRMPDIIDTVDSINSIETKYPKERQDSKAPTFALQYGGTYKTLNVNSGIPIPLSIQIESNYHDLYKVTDEFNHDQVVFASDHGYVECAFGLRLRTPILRDSVQDKRLRMYAAESEGRSAVNAVTQSWGMLINRTAIAFTEKLIHSTERKNIKPTNTIHDALYFLVRILPKSIKWLNDNLIKEMEWNDHPDIKSDDVPMAADLTIGPSWDKQYKIKNNAFIEDIEAVIAENNL